MSLLDDGPDQAIVYPQVAGVDDQGNPVMVPDSVGVLVHCRIAPFNSTDVVTAGQATDTVYKLVARKAPLGAWALVKWDGRDWDLLGEPLWYRGSPRTAHVTALIRSGGGGLGGVRYPRS